MMGRREFMALLGGAAAAWSLSARAQQPTMPVIVFLHPGVSEVGARDVAAFRKGLQETGYIEGQNVTVEYHWLEGQYGRLPAVMADVIRRRVDVIAIPGSVVAARAAKAATATIPIVFQIGDDPVQAGLVASLGRPGGNITGVTSLNVEVTPKRLRLLHELADLTSCTSVAVSANGVCYFRDLRKGINLLRPVPVGSHAAERLE
jgi:putative ABC transport system substrate-binding protein